jgi:methionyl-tRNA formyltransferase
VTAEPRPMRVVFLGSGGFGGPTLEALVADPAFEVTLVVTPPDRPAGRRRRLAAAPIASLAERLGLPVLRTEDCNREADLAAIERAAPEALVVIAFGQKLGARLCGIAFAINLHASLLPAHRGAAPIQRAIMAGDRTTGLSVISLAERMDAGEVHARCETGIGIAETAGELHDRLAAMGPDLVLETLRRARDGRLAPEVQDEASATHAAKIGRGDAVVDFGRDATFLRGWIHGLSPRPGCTISIGGDSLRLLRVEAVEAGDALPREGDDELAPGTLVAEGLLKCGRGWLRPLEVQPAGGTVMSWEAWRRGRPALVAPIAPIEATSP